MDAQYKTDLEQVLAAVQPCTLLCVGAPCPPLVETYVQAAPERLSHHLPYDITLQHLDTLGQFDLILVADTLEHLDKGNGEQLLARLRDLHGGRLLVLLPMPSANGPSTSWSMNDLLAFGMTLIGRYPEADGELQLYHFDLNNYKTVPDWFNPRFWAHPERWDKDFW